MKLGYISERSSLPLPTSTTTSTTTARATATTTASVTTILNPFTVIKGMISAPVKRMSGKYNRAWYEKKKFNLLFQKKSKFFRVCLPNLITRGPQVRYNDLNSQLLKSRTAVLNLLCWEHIGYCPVTQTNQRNCPRNPFSTPLIEARLNYYFVHELIWYSI